MSDDKSNPWTFWVNTARFGWEAQQVVAMRMMRLATAEHDHQVELERMIVEKSHAFMEAQIAYATATMTGASPVVAWAKAQAPYRKRVRANRRRLSRPG